jgi:hypothetical protein
MDTFESDAPMAPMGPVDSVPVAVCAGPFTVQQLNDQWFIGLPTAAQRIADASGLESWLAANGGPDLTALDFGGDRDLEQRFRAEFGGANPMSR